MKPGPGSLLIAPPAMTDSRFSKSVLLLTHNNASGAFGLCLNKPTKHNMSALSKELGLDKELPFDLYWGGPVNNGTIWMIHDNSWECEHTLYVNSKWRVTSHESMFHHLADGDVPKEFRTVFGFASWMPGQLDMEIKGVSPFNKKSSWVIVNDSTPEWVFENPVDELWSTATDLAGEQAVNSWF